jgi:hypothetical protein
MKCASSASPDFAVSHCMVGFAAWVVTQTWV